MAMLFHQVPDSVPEALVEKAEALVTEVKEVKFSASQIDHPQIISTAFNNLQYIVYFVLTVWNIFLSCSLQAPATQDVADTLVENNVVTESVSAVKVAINESVAVTVTMLHIISNIFFKSHFFISTLFLKQ